MVLVGSGSGQALGKYWSDASIWKSSFFFLVPTCVFQYLFVSGSSELNKKTVKTDIMRIETLHHADKDKVENYILELLLWLHRLAIKSKGGNDAGEMRSTIKSPIDTSLQLQKTNQQSKNALPPLLTTDEQDMLQDVSKPIRTRGISKSLDFDTGLRDNCRLIKSNSYSSTSKSKESSFNRILSKLPVIDFGIDKRRALDVIDRLEVAR